MINFLTILIIATIIISLICSYMDKLINLDENHSYIDIDYKTLQTFRQIYFFPFINIISLYILIGLYISIRQ